MVVQQCCSHNLAFFILLLFTSFTNSKDTRLKCYTDKLGLKYTWCQKNMKTCYTKLDQKGLVVGRGCSSRPGVFHTQCDSHFGSDHSEMFCYCSYSLCNSSEGTVHFQQYSTLLAVILCLLL